MRKFVYFIVLALTFMTARAQEKEFTQAKVISGGYFFDSKVQTKEVAPSGSTMAMLKDPENRMVIAIYLPQGFVLPESITKKALAAESVQHSAELMRDYEAHRPETTEQFEGILVEVGKKFPPFSDKDIDGNVWNNEKLKGKIWVLNLWQRECGPCRKEMPVLSSWAERFPGVEFFSASRHDAEEIRPIVEQHGFTWKHLQKASDLVKLIGKQGFPLTIVVDRDGIVRFAKTGATESNQNEAVSVIENLIK